MAKKSSRKLVYTLSSQSDLNGHSLGINSLAVDPNPLNPDSKLYSHTLDSSFVRKDHSEPPSNPNDVSGILYSAGRDGSIIAWQLQDMNLDCTDYKSHLYDPSSLNSDPSSRRPNPAFDTASVASSASTVSSAPLTKASLVESSNISKSSAYTLSSSSRYPKSISSLASDLNETSARLIDPSLSAFLNTPPVSDAPTIPPIPLKNQHGKTTFKVSAPVHTNWVNNIILVNNNQSVASCSSDLTVKLWNPHTDSQSALGQHRDFVKCLAAPAISAPSWLVSAGLDHRITSWDISRASSINSASPSSSSTSLNENKSSEIFSIDVGNDEKASVYALAVGGNSIIASGGPDAIVRLWDSRTAAKNSSPIAQFLGHTDNIRSLLVSENGEWVLSASSDSTIKLWSLTAGKVLQTFDMHSSSVWSLYSNHPNFHVFYSSDRSGMIAKTDIRNVSSDINQEGVSCVIANEHQGVSQIVSAGPYIWSATSNSRIHRWLDFDTTPYAFNRVPYYIEPASESTQKDSDKKDDGFIKTHFLNISGTPNLRFNKSQDGLPENDTKSADSIDTGTDSSSVFDALPGDEENLEILESHNVIVEPIHVNPIETLQGKIGLIKHQMLSDRRRVLTVDTAGEIILWDLIQCIPLQTFGSGIDLDTIAEQFKSPTTVISNWCQVTTRTGELFVTLDENTCFDAEVYADEIFPEIGEDVLKKHSQGNPVLCDLVPDQRINLGKWVIRNLFANLLKTEMARDIKYREDLLLKTKKIIEQGDYKITAADAELINSNLVSLSTTNNSITENSANGTSETRAQASSTTTPLSTTHSNSSAKFGTGFMGKLKLFGKKKGDKGANSKTNGHLNGKTVTSADHNTPTTSASVSSDNTGTVGRISTATSMISANGSLNRNDSALKDLIHNIHLNYQQKARTLIVNSASGNKVHTIKEGAIDNELSNEHKEELSIDSLVVSPPQSEAPIIKIPESTKIMISELTPGTEGLVDLYRGTVGCLGLEDADCETKKGHEDCTGNEEDEENTELSKLESVIPLWIADALFKNVLPQKDELKVGFVLVACDETEQVNSSIKPLPQIPPPTVNPPVTSSTGAFTQTSDDSASRTNGMMNPNSINYPNSPASPSQPNMASNPPLQQQQALSTAKLISNHMLRAHRIKAHIIDKLKCVPSASSIPELSKENDSPEADDWIEILCQGHPIHKNMTLSAIRTKLWRSSGDIVIKYRRKY